MPLNLYRRHQKGCEAGFSVDLRTSEFDERKKGAKRCGCFIFASGSLGRSFKRRYTACTEWTAARAVAAQWEANGTWGKVDPTPQAASTSETKPDHITITHATEAFLAKCVNRGIRPNTIAKYRTFTNQLKAWATDIGYVHVDQLTVTGMDAFYGTWKDGIRARAKKLERLKAFVQFCIKRKWLTENIVEDLQAPEGSSVPNPKTPFTDDDIQRLLAACDRIKRTPRRDWDGEDLRDFINLSLHTGFRISDVVLFNAEERLRGNAILLRAHKNGSNVYTWVPDWLADRLRKRQKTHGPLIFRAGTALNMKQKTQIWRDKRLREVFKLAGPWKNLKPTPHLFRHSFARILLERGVGVEDVAQLLGDTPTVVLKHYSSWLPSRQNRLTAILKEAFDDKPKLVAIPRQA